MSPRNCTEVTVQCPVSATTYGYVPNLGGNTTLLVLFVICAITQCGLGVFYRSWSFLVALTGGCVLEFVGYVGRLILRGNVWNDSGFRQQIVCLIIAPSFIAAGIYLSFKHIVIHLSPEASRLSPFLYTWIFIGCDIFSIVVQAAGGGVAASAGKTNPSLLQTGNNMMVAGIAIQVVTMAICGLLALDYTVRYQRACQMRQARGGDDLNEQPTNQSRMGNVRFKIFCAAEIFAYITVLTRCIYRLPEMGDGWGNRLMRDETEFLVLDGMMIALAVVTLTIFHPGYWFPVMTGRGTKPAKSDDRELSSFNG